jgi:hypothetical protein
MVLSPFLTEWIPICCVFDCWKHSWIVRYEQECLGLGSPLLALGILSWRLGDSLARQVAERPLLFAGAGACLRAPSPGVAQRAAPTSIAETGAEGCPVLKRSNRV